MKLVQVFAATGCLWVASVTLRVIVARSCDLRREALGSSPAGPTGTLRVPWELLRNSRASSVSGVRDLSSGDRVSSAFVLGADYPLGGQNGVATSLDLNGHLRGHVHSSVAPLHRLGL